MQISHWLASQSKDYNAGVQLYEMYSPDKNLLALFKASKTKFAEKKLLQVLTDLKAEFEAKQDYKTKPTPKPSIDYTNIPPVLIPIHELRISSYKTIALLHNKLCELYELEKKQPKSKRDFKTERFEIQKELLVYDAINDDCWYKIDYYKEHGKLPPEPTADVWDINKQTIDSLVKDLMVIPTYVTKTKKQLKADNLTDDRYNELVSRNVNYELRLTDIKAAIAKLPTYGEILNLINPNK